MHYSYTFQVYLLKNITEAAPTYQEKLRFHSELDSALQAREDVPNVMQTI
jgi:hypothetical protein